MHLTWKTLCSRFNDQKVQALDCLQNKNESSSFGLFYRFVSVKLFQPFIYFCLSFGVQLVFVRINHTHGY